MNISSQPKIPFPSFGNGLCKSCQQSTDIACPLTPPLFPVGIGVCGKQAGLLAHGYHFTVPSHTMYSGFTASSHLQWRDRIGL